MNSYWVLGILAGVFSLGGLWMWSLSKAMTDLRKRMVRIDLEIEDVRSKYFQIGSIGEYGFSQSIKNINDANSAWDKERERIIGTFVECLGHAPEDKADLEYRVLKNRAKHIKDFETLKVWLIHFIDMTEKPNDT